MGAHERYYQAVQAALAIEGWEISHDPPYHVLFHGKAAFQGFGAKPEDIDPMIGAARDTTRIAVLVHTFTEPSIMLDFQHARGAFLVYHTL